MMFSDLATRCLIRLSAKARAQSTIERYDFAYGAFRDFLKARKLEDSLRHFTGELVEAFAVQRMQDGTHANTVRTDLSALRTLAEFGMTDRDERNRPRVSLDPTRTFEWPTYLRPTTDFLYFEEQAKLLALDLPLRERFAINLIWETGLRVSEVCRPNVCDLVREDGRWFLFVTVKGRGRRDDRVGTPLSADLGALWESYYDERLPQPEEPLLLNHDGRRWKRNQLSTMIKRAARQAGITRIAVSAHRLRHTANVNEYAAGVKPEVRARLRHHANLRTLERYDHLLPGDLAEARDHTSAWVRSRLRSVSRAESGGGAPNLGSPRREDSYDGPGH